jgi:hypothetical protein
LRKIEKEQEEKREGRREKERRKLGLRNTYIMPVRLVFFPPPPRRPRKREVDCVVAAAAAAAAAATSRGESAGGSRFRLQVFSSPCRRWAKAVRVREVEDEYRQSRKRREG